MTGTHRSLFKGTNRTAINDYTNVLPCSITVRRPFHQPSVGIIKIVKQSIQFVTRLLTKYLERYDTQWHIMYQYRLKAEVCHHTNPVVTDDTVGWHHLPICVSTWFKITSNFTALTYVGCRSKFERTKQTIRLTREIYNLTILSVLVIYNQSCLEQ